MTDDSIYFQISRDGQKQAFHEARDELARDRDVDADSLTRPEVLARACRCYVSLSRLRQDDRFQATIEHVAEDHGMDPEDITEGAALKAALAAYNGFNSGREWPVEP